MSDSYLGFDQEYSLEHLTKRWEFHSGFRAVWPTMFLYALWWWQGVAIPSVYMIFLEAINTSNALVENAELFPVITWAGMSILVFSFKLDRWSWKVNRSRAVSPQNVLREIISIAHLCSYSFYYSQVDVILLLVNSQNKGNCIKTKCKIVLVKSKR